MGATIHYIIAAIRPEVYCTRQSGRQVKAMLAKARQHREQADFLRIAAAAQLGEPNSEPLETLEEENAFSLPGFKCPLERHKLGYDSLNDSLESFYFRIVDQLSGEGWQVLKLEDNHASTLGSGLFSDMIKHQSQVQRDAAQLLRQSQYLINDILRTAATFQSNLAGSPLPARGSQSEMDRRVLMSKLSMLKLCAHWLSPWLSQSDQLQPSAGSGVDLVSLFNTATARLTIVAHKPFNLAEAVDKGELPKAFLKERHGNCSLVLVLEFAIRSAPIRVSAGQYAHPGRVDLTMTSYALNQDEIKVLEDEMEDLRFQQLIGLVGRDATKALNEVIAELERGLRPEEQIPRKPDDPNPFLALFGIGESPGSGDISSDQTAPTAWDMKRDSRFEAVIRSIAILKARRSCLELYGFCKQMLQMPVF